MLRAWRVKQSVNAVAESGKVGYDESKNDKYINNKYISAYTCVRLCVRIRKL